MFEKIRERHRINRLIRNAIDSYPEGICFAAADGRPILVNRKINEICFALTDHTITNAAVTWNELGRQALQELYDDAADREDCAIRSSENENKENKEDRQILACRLSDDSVWQFRKTPCSVGGMQVIRYEASDITELYEYRRQLRENNVRDTQLHERQRELLHNIVQNNIDQELLHAKMRIHDDFGRLLIMTGNMLTDHDSGQDGSQAKERNSSPAREENRSQAGISAGASDIGKSADDLSRERRRQDLFNAWRDVIKDMEIAPPAGSPEGPSPQKELVQVADMIGCSLEFHGDQPKERKAMLLLYAAIREALTNAVRHAGADKLLITINPGKDAYYVEIADNGTPGDPSRSGASVSAASPVKEGSGLGALRRKLETAGATLNYRYDNGVVMVLTIPKES